MKWDVIGYVVDLYRLRGFLLLCVYKFRGWFCLMFFFRFSVIFGFRIYVSGYFLFCINIKVIFIFFWRLILNKCLLCIRKCVKCMLWIIFCLFSKFFLSVFFVLGRFVFGIWNIFVNKIDKNFVLWDLYIGE